MKLTQLFLEELDREADRTRRALEQVPTGKDDWKRHPQSMPLGRLAGLVASMPSWVSLIIDQPHIDIMPAQGQGQSNMRSHFEAAPVSKISPRPRRNTADSRGEQKTILEP